MSRLCPIDVPPLRDGCAKEYDTEEESYEPAYVNSRKPVDPSDELLVDPKDAIVKDEQAASREELVDVEEWCDDICQLLLC
jgi:hypothetical protein